MTLDKAVRIIADRLNRMNALFGRVIFDEWSLVAVLDRKGRILHYAGPRKPEFQANFLSDVQRFRAQLASPDHSIGDFEFCKEAVGTAFDAYLVVGDSIFAILNNTKEAMAAITANPLWLSAQVPFAELSEAFRSDPLVHPM